MFISITAATDITASTTVTTTSEKPKPSVMGYQALLKLKSRTFSPTASSSRRVSPPLLR